MSKRLAKKRVPGKPKRTARAPRVAAARPNRFHAYLKRLRAGGRSNMYGAIPYLMHAFALDRETAFRVVCEWVDQHESEMRALAAEASPAQ